MKYCLKCQRSYAATQTLCAHDGGLLSLKDPYSLTGRIINDRYLIESLIAVGGMSAVYSARQIGVERRVAFKILLPHLALQNHNMHSLFEREARTAGRLTHENIATVHDAGRTNDGISYIAMEWLEGKTLENELSECAQFSFQRIAYLLRQIAAALDSAHTHNVIHRDLKPSNIMIVARPDGRDLVKVLDFGLAKITNESTQLEVSSALGTPHYASPEQFRIGEEIDGRSDIYSLGVMIYRLLTGQMPFEAASVHELIRMHLLESPPPLRALRPDASLELEYLVSRMLAKTPHYRPASGAEAAEAYEQAIQMLPGSERQTVSHKRNSDSLAPNLADGSRGSYANGYSNGYDSRQTSPLPAAPPVIGATSFANSLSIPGGQPNGQPAGRGGRAGLSHSDIGEKPVVLPVAPSPVNYEEKPADSPSGNHSQAARTRGATFVSVSAGSPQNMPKRVTGSLSPPAPVKSPAVTDATELQKPPPLIKMQVADSRKLILWLIAAALIGSAVFYFFYNRQHKLLAKDTALVTRHFELTGNEVYDQTRMPALALQLAQAPVVYALCRPNAVLFLPVPDLAKKEFTAS